MENNNNNIKFLYLIYFLFLFLNGCNSNYFFHKAKKNEKAIVVNAKSKIYFVNDINFTDINNNLSFNLYDTLDLVGFYPEINGKRGKTFYKYNDNYYGSYMPDIYPLKIYRKNIIKSFTTFHISKDKEIWSNIFYYFNNIKMFKVDYLTDLIIKFTDDVNPTFSKNGWTHIYNVNRTYNKDSVTIYSDSYNFFDKSDNLDLSSKHLIYYLTFGEEY